MCIILALLCKKFKPSSSSRERHLISRSPGIISFFDESNYRLERLYSTGSVTTMMYF